MRKLFLSAAVAMALGVASGAQASSTILFDTNGAAPGGVIAVDTFDWAPDNALCVNCNNVSAAPGPFTVVAEGSLGSFIRSGNPQTFISPTPGTEYTFQLNMLESATGLGTATAGFTPLSGTLNIWYDTTADANQLAGTGYNDGQLILTAQVVPGSNSAGTFTNLTTALPGQFPSTNLDNFNANNYPGILSDRGSGNTNLAFHVTFADPAFFLSNITSISIGMQDSSNNSTPFNQADPSAQIQGIAPVFTNVGGTLINGRACGPGTANPTQLRCDQLLQTDAASTFNPVPEPGSLALLSLGLLGAGLARRKTRN